MSVMPRDAGPDPAAYRGALADCRDTTLALFDGIDDAAFRAQPDPAFSPVGWHLGHIAYTEAYWIVETCAGRPVPRPEYARLFDRDALPKGRRGDIPGPDLVLAYAAEVRAAVEACLDGIDRAAQGQVLAFVLQHEAMHAETVAVVRRLLGRGREAPPGPGLGEPGQVTLAVPAGPVQRGGAGAEALDNERPAHITPVPAFRIDRYAVTVGQFATFMAAGGYEEARWWSAEGWAWRQAADVCQPLYWRPDLEDHPVLGLSAHEADAYCRFAGARLPSEAEWERAAAASRAPADAAPHPWGDAPPDQVKCNFAGDSGHTSPVTDHRAGRSGFGCDDMLGNVWEWTADSFAPYEGFAPFPYDGYSAPYFDGRHRVAKGGSFATPRWVLRRSFRNWFSPETRQIFTGLRLAHDA